MNFLKNLRISTVSVVFVVILVVAGGTFIATSMVSVENTTAIRTIWDEFQASRSEKARALNALRKDIGYGGMIHQFKNYVLRADPKFIRLVNAKLGGAAGAISSYRALGQDGQEFRALKSIEDMLNAYSVALSQARRQVADGKSPSEIDSLVKVDDASALDALDTLDQITGQGITVAGKPQHVAALRKAMGYGGVIHQFKNFVLRHDHDRMQLVETKLDAARKVIAAYRSEDLSAAERKAIGDISGVVEAYGVAMIQADKLSEGKMTVTEIDKAVRVDDVPALMAFDILTREIAKDSEAKAEKVNEALVLVSSVAETTAWATLITIALLILGSLWIFRYRILGPLSRMTDVMTELAGGNLDIQVQGAGRDNEVGEMARAIEVFKENAIERNRAEVAVRNREARIRAILENVIDGIITIDEKGGVETFNRAAEVLFGYHADEVIGHNIKMLMPDPYFREHDGYLANYRETGEAKIMGSGREVEGKRKDGSTFPMELSVGEMQIDGQRMFTGIVRDITERKQGEQMKNEFVSTVSHELRTPLTSIKGSLGLVRSGAAGEMPEKLKGMLDIAYNNSDRLIRLINDILDIEKISAGKMDFSVAPIDLSALIEQAVDANKGYGEGRNVSLSIIKAIPGAMVEGDHDRLMQVMANLLSNAVKYAPTGDAVEISLSREDDNLHVAVSDRGSGIPEEFQDRIFEKFSQADSSDTRQVGGTGLGLSITQAIIEHHDGEIGFETTTGTGKDTGTTFYFNLKELVARKRIMPAENKSGLRILHIEDEPDVIEIVSLLVEDIAEVTHATSCAEGRKLLVEEAFDLVILDLILPDGEGEALLPLLKQGINGETPVIVFSARELEADGDMIHTVMVKSQTTNETLLRVIKSALGV